jgi:hypothetical protein
MLSDNAVEWFTDRQTGETFVADVERMGGPRLTLVPIGDEAVSWEALASPADFDRAMQIKDALRRG